MQNSSRQAASTAARTTGRYSGLQPAMTALIATFSMVHGTLSGGMMPMNSAGERVVPVEHVDNALFGRRHKRQAI